MPPPKIATFPNPHPARDYSIEHVAPEFTSLCPVTGQPDFATVRCLYTPDQLCFELKSYKLYLQSFRTTGIFYEDLTNRILNDLVAAVHPRRLTVITEWTPRGGLHSIIRAEYPAHPARRSAPRRRV